jgi:hypothetical protein
MQQARSDGGAAGCETCHTTTSWKELSGFDHSKTAFPLVGTHRATACIDCHRPPNLETKLVKADFKAAPTKCEECHQDVHGAQFASSQVTACAECHNSTKWKPSLFDHDTRTQFPLQGAHHNVACEGCHKLNRVVEGKTVLFYKPTPKECAACHGSNASAKNLGNHGQVTRKTCSTLQKLHDSEVHGDRLKRNGTFLNWPSERTLR